MDAYAFIDGGGGGGEAKLKPKPKPKSKPKKNAPSAELQEAIATAATSVTSGAGSDYYGQQIKDINLILHPSDETKAGRKAAAYRPGAQASGSELVIAAILVAMEQHSAEFDRRVTTQGERAAEAETKVGKDQLSREKALELLTKETEVRFSAELQAQLTLDNNHNLKLINKAQMNVLSSLGYEPSKKNIRMMHAQRFYYRGDPEFAEKSVYVRHDGRRPGDLVAGVSPFPDVSLAPLDDGAEVVKLSSLVTSSSRPLVVIAGSLT
jgi:hypothetical protein